MYVNILFLFLTGSGSSGELLNAAWARGGQVEGIRACWLAYEQKSTEAVRRVGRQAGGRASKQACQTAGGQAGRAQASSQAGRRADW